MIDHFLSNAQRHNRYLHRHLNAIQQACHDQDPEKIHHHIEAVGIQTLWINDAMKQIKRQIKADLEAIKARPNAT